MHSSTIILLKQIEIKLFDTMHKRCAKKVQGERSMSIAKKPGHAKPQCLLNAEHRTTQSRRDKTIQSKIISPRGTNLTMNASRDGE